MCSYNYGVDDSSVISAEKEWRTINPINQIWTTQQEKQKKKKK